MQKNKVQLIGHLFDEPVFSKLETGKLKAELKLTILTEILNGEEEKVAYTEVYNLICKGKFAEFVKTYMVAGIEMAIDGRLINVMKKDKDGIERLYTCVEVQELLVLSTPKKKPAEKK